MNSWLLLAIPGSVVFLMGLLFMSAWVEERVLCPQALILRAAKARRNTPEFAEQFVAQEFDRLLRQAQR